MAFLPLRWLGPNRNHERFYGLSFEVLLEGGFHLICLAIDCFYAIRSSFRLSVYCSFLGQPFRQFVYLHDFRQAKLGNVSCSRNQYSVYFDLK